MILMSGIFGVANCNHRKYSMSLVLIQNHSLLTEMIHGKYSMCFVFDL
jgi:hypothetical protein